MFLFLKRLTASLNFLIKKKHSVANLRIIRLAMLFRMKMFIQHSLLYDSYATLYTTQLDIYIHKRH